MARADGGRVREGQPSATSARVRHRFMAPVGRELWLSVLLPVVPVVLPATAWSYSSPTALCS